MSDNAKRKNAESGSMIPVKFCPQNAITVEAPYATPLLKEFNAGHITPINAGIQNSTKTRRMFLFFDKNTKSVPINKINKVKSHKAIQSASLLII